MQTDMKMHVKVLGWLYIILGALGLLAAGIVILAVAGGGLISGDRTAITVTFIVAAVVGGIIILLSAPGVIAGIGMLAFKPWARILGLILGILNLPGFPLGTILGLYSLYVLLDDETSHLFNAREIRPA